MWIPVSVPFDSFIDFLAIKPYMIAHIAEAIPKGFREINGKETIPNESDFAAYVLVRGLPAFKNFNPHLEQKLLTSGFSFPHPGQNFINTLLRSLSKSKSSR